MTTDSAEHPPQTQLLATLAAVAADIPALVAEAERCSPTRRCGGRGRRSGSGRHAGPARPPSGPRAAHPARSAARHPAPDPAGDRARRARQRHRGTRPALPLRAAPPRLATSRRTVIGFSRRRTPTSASLRISIWWRALSRRTAGAESRPVARVARCRTAARAARAPDAVRLRVVTSPSACAPSHALLRGLSLPARLHQVLKIEDNHRHRRTLGGLCPSKFYT